MISFLSTLPTLDHCALALQKIQYSTQSEKTSRVCILQKIDVAQRIWPWGCPTKARKQPKNAFLVLFGCFWAFVGQPHGHIRWATSMPFASFNPTNPRTNLRNFRKKILRIGDFEKWAFFESAILNFFFWKKKIFFCFIPMKISPNLYGRMDGSKFWCFPWFPENSLLCVILRYTVYITHSCSYIVCISWSYLK